MAQDDLYSTVCTNCDEQISQGLFLCIDCEEQAFVSQVVTSLDKHISNQPRSYFANSATQLLTSDPYTGVEPVGAKPLPLYVDDRELKAKLRRRLINLNIPINLSTLPLRKKEYV